MQKDNFPSPLLRVKVEEPGHDAFDLYAHIHLEFVYLDQVINHIPRYRLYYDNDCTDDRFYANLQIRSQIDGGEREDESLWRICYGWQLEYRQLHSADLRDADRMAKTLRKIVRGYQTRTAKLGDSQSFGQYVAVIADTIGCKGILTPATPQEKEMSELDWLLKEPGAAVRWIDRKTLELRRLCLERSQAA